MKKYIQFLLYLYNKQRFLMVLFILLSIVGSIVGVITPMLFGLFIDYVLGPRDLHILLKFMLIVLAVGIVFSILKFITIIINNRLIINTNYYLGSVIRNRIQKVKKETLFHKDNANLIQVITRDLANCQLIFNYALSIFLEVMSFAIVFYILFKINPLLPITFALALPIYYLAYRFFSNRISYIYNKIIQSTDKISKVIEDIRNNFLAYKRNASMNTFDKEYDHLLKDIYHWQRRRGFNEGYFGLANQLLLFLISISVLFYGGYLVITDSLTLGFLTTLIIYSTRFFTPIENISGLLVSCKMAMISVRRAYHYYHLSVEIEGEKDLKITKGQIHIKEYSFPNQFSLSAQIQRERLNFLIGPNGVGKSTLINSIIKEREVKKDTIYIDNIDIVSTSQKEINKNMIVLFQQEQFVGYTVQEQLYYADLKGENSTIDSRIKEKIRAFTDDIAIKFNLESNISELSGGQRQYLLIISALRAFPQILVLDETLSHLDEETNQRIYSFLREISTGVTIVIITHNNQYIDPKKDHIISVYTRNSTIKENGEEIVS